MKDFIKIEAAENELLLEGFFGMWPIVKDEVAFILDQINPEQELTVYLDSGGGDPNTAIAIRRKIASHPGKKTLYVQGNIMSAATLLPGVFDEVVTDPFSVWLLHNPKIDPDWVDGDEAQAMTNMIKITTARMADIYAKDSGQNLETVTAWMKETKVFSGTEAVELGFADRTGIADQRRVEAPAEDLRMAASAYDIPADKLTTGRTSPRHKANQQKETTTMSQPSWIDKMKAALGLGDDKDEADAVLSIRELKAKAQKAETLSTDLEDLQKENKKLLDKLEELKKEQETSEEETESAIKAQRDSAVQAAIDSFRIKASQKEEWLEDYADKEPAKLKAALERIPEGAAKPGGSGDPKGPKKPAMKAAFGLNDVIAKDLGQN